MFSFKRKIDFCKVSVTEFFCKFIYAHSRGVYVINTSIRVCDLALTLQVL